MSFEGFGPQALKFLQALAFHQTKEWFEDNRDIYDNEVRAPLGDFVEDAAARLTKSKIPIKGDRKSSLFRIHRDVRFAKDKSPYKTNAGVAMTRSGAKNDPGVLYFHLSPEGCFFAAGFHMPEPPQLARLRGAAKRAPGAFKAMSAKLAKSRLAFSDEDRLTRAPRGYEEIADAEIAAAARLKSFICVRTILEKRIARPGLVDDFAVFASDALPLLTWGWQALADER
jgi:uncharacterized protein (TIGR02453 family)